MKVDFNPAVNFKSSTEQTNLLAGAKPYVAKPKEKDEFVYDKTKVDNFKSRLKDLDWKKEYLPNADIVYVKHKNMIDGLEYEISSDGTVREVGCWVKPTIIINPNKEMADYVSNFSNKHGAAVKEISNDEPKHKLSFKEKVKVGIANVWKFFSVTGTMSYAAAKGALYGAAVATAGLFAAIVLRAPKILKAEGANLATIYKQPFKAAGKVGTLVAAAGGLATLGANLVAGKLEANQNSSVIEHKMDVAHVYD